jgi:biotin carboxyl carrier protein
MENSINIPVTAKIRKVLVKKGQAVEKNQVMIELE